MVQLVGILNVTPDSFSDGGQFAAPPAALARAKQLFADGAALVDVGAESTRPGATPLTPAQEWQRLEPILKQLLQQYPGQIALDTYHPETARRALELGPLTINDVTGLNNPAMAELVTSRRTRCIVSHLRGTDPQAAHRGELLDDPQPIASDLLAKAAMLEAAGLERDQFILDPGIGFGKTPGLNRRLLEFARLAPGYQVMIGYSRKRFLGGRRLELEPNLAAGRIAIEAGAAFLRVHDVAGHRRLLEED